MYFFIHDPLRRWSGSGGFKGAPLDGMVEIGYEIAPCPAWSGGQHVRCRRDARPREESGDVSRVTAQTLPEINESGAVLEKVGFVRVGEIPIVTSVRPGVGNSGGRALLRVSKVP